MRTLVVLGVLACAAAAQPDAEFSASPTSGITPVTVSFTDESTGGPFIAWVWKFGDGAMSGEPDPEHTYDAPGVYSVELTVFKQVGIFIEFDSELKRDLVTVDPVVYAPDFTVSPESGVNPLTVAFTDATVGADPTGWLWDLGDGTTSAARDPEHTYLAPGAYTVSLTAFVGVQSETITKADAVVVEPAPLFPDFTVSQTSGPSLLAVSFTDASTGVEPTSRLWDFGDGTTSTLEDPDHAYCVSGSYSVSLTLFVEQQEATLVKPDLIAVEPGPASPQSYLKASDARAETLFGSSVAVSDGTLVVGAIDADGVGVLRSGSAYVFTRDRLGWAQRALLKAANAGEDDRFGNAVAVSGDTVVVSATLESSAATGVDGDPFNDDAKFSGAVYVFERADGGWTQQAYLKASNTDPSDRFGSSVAIDGDTIVVGASSEDSAATGVDGDQADNSSPASGAAYVFVRDGDTWVQQAYLKATGSGGLFGEAVSVSGDTVIVGAPFADEPAQYAGAAYVFVRDGSTWSPQASLAASNRDPSDHFGESVALLGDTAIVGAPDEDSVSDFIDARAASNGAESAGAAYVFTRDGDAWSQQAYLKACNSQAADRFGASVAAADDRVVVAAPHENGSSPGVDGDPLDNGAPRSGAVFLFEREGVVWNPRGYLKASNPDTYDEFGSGLAMSADTVVVGARYEDSVATGVDGDQDDDSASQAGAAYTFSLESNSAFLVVGAVPGTDPFAAAGHLFETALGAIENAYPLAAGDVPEFPLPLDGTRDAPPWLQDGECAVQVVMWAPGARPRRPEQCSAGLYVRVLPDGSLVTRPYGAGTGVELRAETDVDAQGRPVVRFPFLVPGL